MDLNETWQEPNLYKCSDFRKRQKGSAPKQYLEDELGQEGYEEAEGQWKDTIMNDNGLKKKTRHGYTS